MNCFVCESYTKPQLITTNKYTDETVSVCQACAYELGTYNLAKRLGY